MRVERKLLFFFCCLISIFCLCSADYNIYIWTSQYFGTIDERSAIGRAGAELASSGYKFIPVQSLDHLQDPALIIACDVPYGRMQSLKQYPRKKCILMTWEPPSVKQYNFDLLKHRFFSKIYTWHDGLVDNVNYFKFYYYAEARQIPVLIDFGQKKLCAMVSSNKHSGHPDELYSERVRAIEFFEKNHSDDFDLYGHNWGNYQTCRGTVEDKIACLSKYKFCMCYENIKNLPGYVTEKIFDCFYAGCVPVYWGAPNIETYVPKNCFIARTDFDSYEELYRFMNDMSEETYRAYSANIKEFLSSEKARCYTPRYFIDSFKKMVLDLTQPKKNTAKNDTDGNDQKSESHSSFNSSSGPCFANRPPAKVDGYFTTNFFDSLACILHRDKNYKALYRVKKDEDWLRAKLLYDRYVRNSASGKQKVLRIPKKIHQIWLGSPFPERYREFQRSWQIKHPDWEYKLWTDEVIAEFGLINQEAYDQTHNYGQKSDIARYEILFREGGLYVDTDFECLYPFDILHYNLDFYAGAGFGPQFLMYNGLVACAPGHPILGECIKTLDINRAYFHDVHSNIQFTTGPNHLTGCFRNHVKNRKDTRDRSVVFPPGFFYPWPNNHRSENTRKQIDSWIQPESMAIHYWDVSWVN